MRKLLLAILLFSLAGCAFNPLTQEATLHENQQPPLNKEAEATAGDILFSELNFITFKVAILSGSLSFKAGTHAALTSGTILYGSLDKNGKEFYCRTDFLGEERIPIDVCVDTGQFGQMPECHTEYNSFADYSTVCLVSSDGKNFSAGTLNDGQFSINIPVPFTTKIISNNNGMKYEFIYEGMEDKTLKFMYKEYHGDMTTADISTPTKTQEVRYTVAKFPVRIEFQDLRVKVLEAQDKSIKYTVEDPFIVGYHPIHAQKPDGAAK